LLIEKDSQHKKAPESHLSQLASVGQIAAGIAHEVRNPLTAVRGFLQLLKEKNEPHFIDIAQTELDNAIAILQNLLQVSKPDLDDEPFQTVDLALELELILQLFQDQFYRVTIHKDFHEIGTYIFGKKNQLKKVFFNLLKNAFEAIPDKGTVTISHTASEQFVKIVIRDSGQGIPEEKLRMLGTPFFSTKQNGTGMGLTLVFSVVYQHNGSIEVESEEGIGTAFTITMPRATEIKQKEVVRLNLQLTGDLKDYFFVNRKAFEEQLLLEAVNVRDKIDEILAVGNINLLDNAHKLVTYIVEGREHEVIQFAKGEGINWAKHSLTLAFKLEWIQTVRRVMWIFLYNYNRLQGGEFSDSEPFFNLEKRINELMDHFLNHLFMSYSQFKDDLIRKQRAMVDDLSVPVIPLTGSASILPLIGPIDSVRADTIEEKILNQIGTNSIETLIIDLSGVANMEADVIRRFLAIIEGIKMMGCEVIVTGLRPEIVRLIIRLGLSFENRALTKGTLQQAVVDQLAKG